MKLLLRLASTTAFLLHIQMTGGIWFDNFIRECGNPILVADRQTRRDPPYCQYSCGDNTDFNCNNNGMCICRLPCYDGNQPRPGALALDICPPLATDPPSPDPFWPVLCQLKCKVECSGGTGHICGEVRPLPDANGALTLYSLICNCVCPAQQACAMTPPAPSTSNPPFQNGATLAAIGTLVGAMTKTLKTISWILKKFYILGWIYLQFYAAGAVLLYFTVAIWSVYLAVAGIDATQTLEIITQLLT